MSSATSSPAREATRPQSTWPIAAERPAPDWVRTVSRFNPVNWAADAGRSATVGHIDWGLVGSRVGCLAALLVVCAAFATRAFGAYQRSL